MKLAVISFFLFATFSLCAQSNPVPFVAQPLLPTSTTPGGPEFTLTVNGTGFVSSSVVNWNGNALTTQFISQSRLTATVPASRIAKAQTASISVVNPAKLISNVAYFAVVMPVASVAFSGAQFQTSGKSPIASIAADFNGDGILDMAITSGWPDSLVSILLGKGDGTFLPPVSYRAGISPGNMVTGDFNNDGKLDLVVLEVDEFRKSLSLFLGNGDGTFQPRIAVLAGGFQTTAVAGDFNGDGKLDLAIAEYGYLSILLGNGDGTFSRHEMLNNSSGICAGDFNGDGILDLAVAFQYYGEPATGVHVFLGRGDGTFRNGVGYDTDDQYATGIACADLSGDGVLDLIVGTLNGATVLLGHGDGTFGAGTTYVTQLQGGHSLAVADFNGDGKLDVAVNNEYTLFANNVSVLLGNGDGTLQAASYFQSGLGDYADLTAGDFNNDGAMDFGEAASGNALAPGYGFVSLQTNGSAILFSAAALDFNVVQLLGTQSVPQSVVMTNVGKERLDIARIGLLGTNPHDFQQSNNCGTSLPIGSSCQIDVTFDPQDRGWRRTSLTVTANTITHDQSISLFGVATSVTLSPSSLNFGNQKVGTVSDPQVVTLTNVGNKPVSIYSLGIIGQFPQVFLQSNTCGTSVAAGASCTINVQFAPKLTRGFVESLGVKDDGGGQMQKIQVTGTGT